MVKKIMILYIILAIFISYNLLSVFIVVKVNKPDIYRNITISCIEELKMNRKLIRFK